MKAAVLSGKELIARAEVSDCPGPNWPELGIVTFLAAYKIKAVRIIDEGTSSHHTISHSSYL
jgi:hypothetical protein